MRISKLISILLILALALSCFSCQINDDDFVEKDNGSSQNGGANQNSSSGKTEYVYHGGGSAHTIHRTNCTYALSIPEAVKVTYDGDPLELIDLDFRFCGVCCPEESALYNPKPEAGEGNGITKDEATYALNTGTKKIHTVDCQYAEDMTNPKLEYTILSLNELLYNKGYSLCQVCHPE